MELPKRLGYFERVELLSRVPLFEPLSREQIEQSGRVIPSISLEPNRQVYTLAYESEFFLLLEGRVRIYKETEGQQFTLRVVKAGEMFGPGLGERKSKRTYAQTLQPSEVAFMNRKTVARLIHEEPLVGLKMVELLCEQLSCYEDKIEDLGLKRVPARLASLLLELVETEGVVIGQGCYRITARYTHEQLGKMIGAKRVAVTRALSRLQAVGVVELRERYIYVKDMDALTRFAEDGLTGASSSLPMHNRDKDRNGHQDAAQDAARRTSASRITDHPTTS